jgi:hypothetical protein
MPVMMKCGHAANAVNGNGDPACVICVGIDLGAEIVDESPPSLEGRMAKCAYRRMRNKQPHPDNLTVPSSPDLAFFEHKPDAEFDVYYCGCWGWD